MTTDENLRPDTVAVRAGRGAGAPGDPVNVPVTLSSIYRTGDEPPAYARERSPTWEALEEVLGVLEGGQAVTFASGIAAMDSVVSLLPDGAALVAPYDAYAGGRALLADLRERGRIELRLTDVADTDATLRACDGAGLLWLESPTNPLMAVADLPALLAAAHERGLLAAVDNTFATPLRQRPLDLGADLVVHSASKFLSGHSDVVLGAAVAADPEVAQRLASYRTTRGAIPGPMETWLALRGVRTLPVRLDRAEVTAGELARRLAKDPRVVTVRYPGLADDPGHDRARAQMSGFGAMFSLELGGADEADALCRAVGLAIHATSLGGVETSVERRARRSLEEHLPPGLVRVSVGCENVEDLWRDLDQALDRAVGQARA